MTPTVRAKCNLLLKPATEQQDHSRREAGDRKKVRGQQCNVLPPEDTRQTCAEGGEPLELGLSIGDKAKVLGIRIAPDWKAFLPGAGKSRIDRDQQANINETNR